MNTPRCPPYRYCLKCNPRLGPPGMPGRKPQVDNDENYQGNLPPSAMYLDPKPRIDCVYCKNCGVQVPVTEYAQHLEGCEAKDGMR